MRRSSELEKLIQGIKQHSPEAHAFLEGKIKATTLRIIRQHGLGYQAEDLWQDIRTKVWKDIDTCLATSEEALKSWTRSIAYNHCRNVIRSERMKTIPIHECLHVEEKTAANNSEPNFENEEFRRKLNKALKNKFERTVIELRYFYDYTPGEIARKSGKSINTINTALLRAKKKLRDYFKR